MEELIKSKMHVKIFTEDTYAPVFFKNLIEKLKNLKKIPSDVNADANVIPGVCSKKMTRAIKASVDDFDKIIVFVDGDGRPEERKTKIEEKHFSKDENKNKIHLIVFTYEIEEWICYSKGIKFDNKPSKALSEWNKNKNGFKSRYEKRDLINYVEDLDVDKLKDYNTFKNFIDLLKF